MFRMESVCLARSLTLRRAASMELAEGFEPPTG